MPEQHDWLAVTLDARVRDELARGRRGAERARAGARPSLAVLRSSRSDLLLDREQGALVLRAITAQGQLPALKARLEAFLGRR